MKSFLLKNNKPIIKWGLLSDNTFFEGKVPEGFDLAVCPGKYIVVDVDRHEGSKSGWDTIRNLHFKLLTDLNSTFRYPTKNKGTHFWFKYTGNKTLMNKSSGLGIDLRIGEKGKNNGGYVKWHPRDSMDIRKEVSKIKETSLEMNKWLEKLFS